MGGKLRNEKRPAQRDVYDPERRAYLDERQRGQHLGVTFLAPAQIGDVIVDDPLDIGAQRRVIFGTQRTVAHYDLGVDHGWGRDRQRVPQAGLGQSLRIHRAQRHDRHRRQNAEGGDGQQPPSGTYPPGQQPQQQGKITGQCVLLQGERQRQRVSAITGLAITGFRSPRARVATAAVRRPPGGTPPHGESR